MIVYWRHRVSFKYVSGEKHLQILNAVNFLNDRDMSTAKQRRSRLCKQKYMSLYFSLLPNHSYISVLFTRIIISLPVGMLVYHQSGSLLYLIILLAGSNTGYGLPSVANDIASNQYFKVFYNLFSFSIISRQITDHPLIILQNNQSFLPGSGNHDVATFLGQFVSRC